MSQDNEQALTRLGLPKSWTKELPFKWLIVVFLVITLFLMLLWYPIISVYEIDDAYITYCYARNLGEGNGYYFNAGEYVEGATSPLWTFLLALLYILGLPLPYYARFLSSCFGVVVTILTVSVSARANNRDRPALADFVPGLLLNAFPSLPFWSGSGMETSLYAAVLLFACLTTIKLQVLYTSILLAILITIRPEAPLFVACFMFNRLIATRSLLQSIKLAFPALLTFMTLMVLRLWYFGDPVPNTYYAKTGGGFLAQLSSGINYNIQFVRTFLPSVLPNADWAAFIEMPLFFAPAIVALYFSKYRIVGLLVLVNFIAVILEGGDWMPGWRFWLSGLPFLYLTITLIAPRLVGWIAPRRIRTLAWPFTILLFLTFGLLLTFIDRFGFRGVLNPTKETRPVYSSIARLLAEHSEPETTTALMDVGRVAYESNRPTIDISGLTDRFIAHSPGGFLNKSYPVEYILRRNPTYVFIRPQFSIDRRIASDSGFGNAYRKEGEVLLNHHDSRELGVLEIYRKIGSYTAEHNATLASLINTFEFKEVGQVLESKGNKVTH